MLFVHMLVAVDVGIFIVFLLNKTYHQIQEQRNFCSFISFFKLLDIMMRLTTIIHAHYDLITETRPCAKIYSGYHFV